MDWSPLVISLKTATMATFISVAIGIPVGYLLSKPFRGRAFASGLTLLPLVLPPTVLGYLLLVVLGKKSGFGVCYAALFHQQLVFSWQGAAVAASIASLPLMISNAIIGFSSVDVNVIGAAKVDGASRIKAFYYIILPLARRSILAGISLAFARSLGDFGATLMVAGNIPGLTRTMPLAVYDALQIDDFHTVWTFVTIGSLLALVASITASRLAER